MSPSTPASSSLTGQPIHLDAGGWGLTWTADGDGVLRQVGLGPGGQQASVDVDPRFYPAAYPTWGEGDLFRPPALRVTHADGTVTTRLRLRDVRRTATSDEVTGGPGESAGGPGESAGEHLELVLQDELFEFRVTVHLRTSGTGMIEQWLTIDHDEPGPVTLHDYDSLFVFLLVTSDARLTQFGGSGWADEWRWTSQALHPGTTSLASFGGLQPHLQRNPTILLEPNGPAGEHDGDVLAVSIAWGGNTRIDLDVRPDANTDSPSSLRLRAGANPVGAEYRLDPDSEFVTPTVAWTWSDSGRATTTDRFHRWTRRRVLRDPDMLRPLVVNNWEATFFDFDQDRLSELIRRSSDLGADVFLLDDGWFGTTHPRDDDTTSLGDWDHDPRKLPGGLAAVAHDAAEAGIGFGIWVEPEMVNPISDLHDAHPEWVLHDQREPRLHRNQLVLDVLQRDVRDFAAGVVDRTLGSAPSTTYVKWDANRPVTDPGSSTLADDRRSNLWVDHVRATWELMDTVAGRHPDVTLMLCASGGGRTDHGTLRYFHEFWTSDNTDPVTRVRMQWACGHFFPAAAIAAHVTRWGERPMDFAAAVALSARFGIDVDLTGLGDEEHDVLRRAVQLARATQDLVQQGRLVRLVSPVDADPIVGARRDLAALGYLSPAGDRAVVFAYQLDDGPSEPVRLPVIGLEGDGPVRVTRHDLRADEPVETNTTDAAALAGDGILWHPAGACTAAIWLIERG